MRIRKAVEKWNWKAFAIIVGSMAVIYNGFFVLAGYAQGGFQAGDEVRFWLLNGVLMPLLIGSALTSTIRKATLYINDVQNLPNFQEQLITHIEATGFRTDHQTPAAIHFLPTSWFYKLLRSWFGTENLLLTIGTEITITGPLKKIADIEEKIHESIG